MRKKIMRPADDTIKERFIIAAIDEIKQRGIVDFSIRNIAKKCHVSSGAPYKHFKSKNEMILEVIHYIDGQWHKKQEEIMKNAPGDVVEQLLDISVGYIVFLHEHPEFQTILMMNDNTIDPDHRSEKAKMSDLSQELITKYCKMVNMSKEDEIRKTYVVRALIFGAAIMFNSDLLEFSDDMLNMMRGCILREFNIA